MKQKIKLKIKENEFLYSSALKSKLLLEKIRWFFTKPSLPKADGMYIHLGCGDINHPKMVNVDLRPASHIHYLSNVEKLPMFSSDCADLIYVSHCLEHISYMRLDVVLQEWQRVLKPGGILRLSVPDFDTIVEIYKDSANNISEILPPLLGGQNYKYNFHYSAFNGKYLTSILKKNGFEDIKYWSYDEDEFSKFNDWANKQMTLNNKDYQISLNIQAKKI